MTPYEAWFGKKPDLAHIRIFGCRCYSHVGKKNRTKWESHTTEGVLMGYFAHEGLYAMYDVNKRVLVKKRDVTFFENVLGPPFMEGYGLAPGFDILGEPMGAVEVMPELVQLEDLDESGYTGVIEEQRIGDLKPSPEDALALWMASMGIYTNVEVGISGAVAVGEVLPEDPSDESTYIPVDTMCSSVSMSFVHQALKEWHQERRSPAKKGIRWIHQI